MASLTLRIQHVALREQTHTKLRRMRRQETMMENQGNRFTELSDSGNVTHKLKKIVS